MTFPWYYILPMIAGLLYAFSAMLNKRALAEGAGLLRCVFISNLFMMVLFAPYWFLQAEETDWSLWWAPVICAVLFVAGILFTFLAIRVGDVTVMTPMMGTKAILVALGSALIFDLPIPWTQWVGAILSALAVFLMGVGDFRTSKGTMRAIVLALLSAAAFGIADVFLGVWAQRFGPQRFLSLLFLFSGLASFGLIPFFREGLDQVPPKAWPWMLAAALVLAVQAVLLGSAIGFFGDATAINIIYSSRGLWSFVLVVWIGNWAGLSERNMGRKLFLLRGGGAVLLTLAIALVLLGPA